MSTSKPTQLLSQAFDDVLAKMMQAKVDGGGPPPAATCDTPTEVASTIHMTALAQSTTHTGDGLDRTVRKA